MIFNDLLTLPTNTYKYVLYVQTYSCITLRHSFYSRNVFCFDYSSNNIIESIVWRSIDHSYQNFCHKTLKNWGPPKFQPRNQSQLQLQLCSAAKFSANSDTAADCTFDNSEAENVSSRFVSSMGLFQLLVAKPAAFSVIFAFFRDLKG